MNAPSRQGWTDTVRRATVTLLLAAAALWIGWQLIKQLLVPLVVLAALLILFKLALGAHRRDDW